MRQHVCTDECGPDALDHVGYPDEVGPEIPADRYPEGATPID